jgi:hypothetical protein
MSDYEVNLVNDNMHEFYVRFHGPAESEAALFSSVSEECSRATALVVCRNDLAHPTL